MLGAFSSRINRDKRAKKAQKITINDDYDHDDERIVNFCSVNAGQGATGDFETTS